MGTSAENTTGLTKPASRSTESTIAFMTPLVCRSEPKAGPSTGGSPASRAGACAAGFAEHGSNGNQEKGGLLPA
jgi:hypothetical protein